MVNIYDIAKKAGVSAATVSKALNGQKDVGLKTREKIKEISRELGYQPSANAQGLATKKTKTIGVFFQDHLNSGFRHPLFQDILSSFKDVVGSRGYDLVFFANHNAENGLEGFDARARHRGVEGLLLYGVARTDPNLVNLAKSKIPCVSMDLDLLGPAAGYVASDNVDGAMQAMNYLVEMGHRDIAYISDINFSKPGHDRLIGYQNALRNHGIPIHSNWIASADFSEKGGYQAAQELLNCEMLPTAIFCSSDVMALGVMEYMRESDLKAGQDISIIGFDDISLLKYVTPGLTTVRQKKEKMSRLAAEELFKIIHVPDHTPSIITVETELIIRDTVKRMN
jgi:LacI family transcriptional regulator